MNNRLTISFFLALLAGCNSSLPNPGAGVGPTTAEERAVAKYIVEKANDPKSVEFVQWGPNFTPGKLDYLCVRVIYRANNLQGVMERFDSIVYVGAGPKVWAVFPNGNGDDWPRNHFNELNRGL
jgi:hypothetical protein